MELRFTVEEFNTMVDELLYRKPASHETLVRIADRTLRGSVIHWCKVDSRLRGREYWEDLLQEILLRLIKTTVSSFLLHKRVVGPYNNDPEGFQRWMFTLAGNVKEDFAKKVFSRESRTTPIDEGDGPIDPMPQDPDSTVEQLKTALSVVLSDDINIYKTLTWLAQFIFILSADVTKIQSNELIITAFESKTLYEMYDMLLLASKKIPWMEIDEAQREHLVSKLKVEYAPGISYGAMKYRDFFMKVRGEASGKKSVSDWVNRINDRIRKKLDIKPNAPVKRKTGKTDKDDTD